MTTDSQSTPTHAGVDAALTALSIEAPAATAGGLKRRRGWFGRKDQASVSPEASDKEKKKEEPVHVSGSVLSSWMLKYALQSSMRCNQ